MGQAGKDVVAVGDEIADAERRARLALPCVAMGREAVTRPDLGTTVASAQDDVDDTGDRIGAVNRGRSIEEDLDAVDHADRNLVQVDEGRRASRNNCRHASAVDQHQGRSETQPPQRDAARAAGARDVVLVPGAEAVGRELLQHFGEGHGARARDLFPRDDLDRRRRLDVRAAQPRTRDPNRVELRSGIGGRGLRMDRSSGHHGEHQNGPRLSDRHRPPLATRDAGGTAVVAVSSIAADLAIAVGISGRCRRAALLRADIRRWRAGSARCAGQRVDP